MLFAPWPEWKMNGAGPWNRCIQISVIMRAEEFDDLPVTDAQKLIDDTLQVLRHHNCRGRATWRNLPVSDDNPLISMKGRQTELPPVGTWVTHDWLWSDRNGDGTITKGDDCKSDPGKALIDALEAAETDYAQAA